MLICEREFKCECEYECDQELSEDGYCACACHLKNDRLSDFTPDGKKISDR